METEHLPSRPLRIRPGIVLLMVAGGLLLLFLTVLTAGWLASHRRLAAELEKIRAAGEPVSAEEVEAFYNAPSPGRDTTQLWLAALAPLDTPQFRADAKDLPLVGDGQDAIPFPGDPWPQLDAAEQFLSGYRPSLDKMHEAARAGGQARFPTRFADGIAMLLPHVQRLRFGARLLELEMVVAAHRGRTDQAVEGVVAMFAAARSLEQEPLTISQMVRMALATIARSRLVWLLSAAELNDDQLKRLDAELATGDYQDSVHRALLGERAIGIQTFADPTALGPEAPPSGLGLMSSGDEIVYLQVMNEMIAAAELTGPERMRALEQAEVRLKAITGGPMARLRYPMTVLIVPALSAFADVASRNEADRDATRVAVAIERFRLHEGRLPTAIDELVPTYLEQVPSDPFSSGLSLKYRVDGAEYLVYSVGSNGIDDGGLSEPAGRPADRVVRVRIKDARQSSAPAEP